MPTAFVKFFEDAREFTEEQIAELKAGHLLREAPPVPAGIPPAPPPPVPADGGQPESGE